MKVLFQKCCRPRSAFFTHAWVALIVHQYTIMPLVRVAFRRQRTYIVCSSAYITTVQSNKTQQLDISTHHDLYSATTDKNSKAGKCSRKSIAFMRLLRRYIMLPNGQCCPIQRRVWPLIWHSIGCLHTNCTSRHVSHKAQRHVCCMALLL